MKFQFIFLCIICFFGIVTTNASNVVLKEDTNKVLLLKKISKHPIQKNQYKLNEKKFNQRYSFDSTSEQIIRSFFKERNIRFDKICRPLILIAVALALGNLAMFFSFVSLWFVTSLLVILMIVSIVLAFVLFFVRLFRFIKNNNRKLLLLELLDYANR